MINYWLKYKYNNNFNCAGFIHNGHNNWFAPDILVSVDESGIVSLQKETLSSSPIFYCYIDGLLIVASNWLDIIKELRKNALKLQCNENYVYDYLKFQCPFTDETFCRNVFYLRNGEHVCINTDGRRDSYFGQLPSVGRSSEPELQALLEHELARLTLSGACFHISSGLDSSILAILAAGLHPGIKVNAATLRTAGKGVSDELDTVQRLAQEFDFNLNIFDFTEIDILDAGKELIKSVMGYPVGHPSHLARFLLDREIGKYADTIVSGRGADECLAGYAWHLPEFSNPAKHIKRLTVTEDELLKKLFRKEIISSRKQQNRSLILSDTNLSLHKRLQYDLLTIFEAWNIIDANLANNLGINIVNPFMNKAIMQSLLELPDEFRIQNGKQKWFLRKTFHDIYPDYILNENSKRALTMDIKPYIVNMSAEQLLKLLYSDSAFGQKYLTKEGCRYLIDRTLNNDRNLGWQIWSIYMCALAYDQLEITGESS